MSETKNIEINEQDILRVFTPAQAAGIAAYGDELVEAIERAANTLDEDEIESMVRQLVEANRKDMTAYRISKILNDALEIFDVDYSVSSQMMYNYDRNKMIVKGRTIGTTRFFTNDEVVEFVTRIVKKRINKK